MKWRRGVASTSINRMPMLGSKGCWMRKNARLGASCMRTDGARFTRRRSRDGAPYFARALRSCYLLASVQNLERCLWLQYRRNSIWAGPMFRPGTQSRPGVGVLLGPNTNRRGGTSNLSAQGRRSLRRARRMPYRRLRLGDAWWRLELQVGKELVPHSQLDDLILLIHQGMQGWVAVDGAEGSIAQRQCLQNRVQRGERDAWETEQWRAAAAGRVRVSGSGADKSSRWRVALTEMVLRGCRQQQLGKDHCEKGRSAFWARLADLRLLGKVFGALKRTLLEASVKRLAALGELRAADEYVSNLEQADGYAKRRLRKEVEKLQVALGEEAAPENPLGAWLLLRAWLAWRTVLARGGGRSGRRVLHGAGRDRLREGLWQVAFGEQREMHTPRIQLAELRLARVRAWRRWLCLGGWGAFHMTCARIARARRSRLLAAQRDGMRRWAARADGRVWHILSDYEIEERFELAHEGLRSLLTTKQILSAGEWKGLGIHHLRLGHYVRVGQGSTEMLYGPGEVASQHTLSGDAAEDVGEVIVLDIAPRGNTQQKKRRRQEVACSRREVQRRVAMGPVRAGVEADDGGRWAVRGIRAVRRHEGRRGRPLDVLVEWEGEDSDGDLWEESWVSVTELTPDLRAEARKLESDLFGPRLGPTVSRRAERRAAAAQRQERERDAQQWRARLRDRAPSGPGSVRSSTD